MDEHETRETKLTKAKTSFGILFALWLVLTSAPLIAQTDAISDRRVMGTQMLPEVRPDAGILASLGKSTGPPSQPTPLPIATKVVPVMLLLSFMLVGASLGLLILNTLGSSSRR